MSLTRRKFDTELTTGFGSTSSRNSGRFYRKDGRPNMIRRGVSLFDRFSPFHTLLSMSSVRFWSWLIGFYVGINILFACIYYAIGVEHLNGTAVNLSEAGKFLEAFFFSAQTYTTVGYGHVNPDGFMMSSVAAIESFLGVMTLALASGIFFGRFSMPRAYLRFSSIALIAPYKGGQALMFRMVPQKNNQLTDAEVRLTVVMKVKEGDQERNQFYTLPVEFAKINTLILNWTIVHPINEESPLSGYSLDELREMETEVMVFVKAYDEVFANDVVARTSYTAGEIIPDAKFRPMYHSEGEMTILEVDKLDAFELLARETTQAG